MVIMIRKLWLPTIMLTIACPSSVAQIVSIADLTETSGGIPGEAEWRGSVPVDDYRSHDAVIRVTPKGNGTLIICNLAKQVYDEHDDGSYFYGGLLDIYAEDINSDGYRDLIMKGVRLYSHEKKRDTVVSHEYLIWMYIYDNEEEAYIRVVESDYIHARLEPDDKMLEKRELNIPSSYNSAVVLWSEHIDIASGCKVQADIELQQEGVGYLCVGKHRIKIYDPIDEDVAQGYDSDMLDVYLLDYDKDGYKDIILTGTKLNGVNDQRGGFLYESCLVLLRYDYENQSFDIVFDSLN